MIDTIWIKSFRSLSEITLTFSKGPFLSIIAKNNIGKTSILEGCFILGHLSSFVSSQLMDVVPFDSTASYLGIKLHQKQRSFNYYMKIDKFGKKYINLNERVVRKKSDIESLFRSVYISSDSLLLITSQPSYRRQQLDQGISQYSQTYRNNISVYKRLIIQKNRLLKENGDHQLIRQLNSQLAPFIKAIQEHRLLYLKDIEKRIQWYLEEMNIIDGHFTIQYGAKLAHLTDEGHILHALNENINKERMIKMANYGPHRDDFTLLINKRNVRLFSSRGICRVLAYFFQLSQAIIIEESTNLPMLMLMDEPFAEVHYDLKFKLMNHIPSPFYIIYTSSQEDEISNLNEAQRFGLSRGKLCSI